MHKCTQYILNSYFTDTDNTFLIFDLFYSTCIYKYNDTKKYLSHSQHIIYMHISDLRFVTVPFYNTVL